MGVIKGAIKAFDSSTTWAANRGGGKVVMSTKNDTRRVSVKGSHQCAGGCGRKAVVVIAGLKLCGKSSCDLD
jgi:hypothetical protein